MFQLAAPRGRRPRHTLSRPLREPGFRGEIRLFTTPGDDESPGFPGLDAPSSPPTRAAPPETRGTDRVNFYFAPDSSDGCSDAAAVGERVVDRVVPLAHG